MAAKDIRLGTDARERMLHGIDILANAVRVTLGPKGPQRRSRQELRGAADHQGRCHRRQGDRAQRQVREHGRADGARGGQQNEHGSRRRHDDGDHSRPRDGARRGQGGSRGDEPDGSQARRRHGGRCRRQGHSKALEEGLDKRRDRAGRHHLGEWRRRDRPDVGRSDEEGRQRGCHYRRGSKVARNRARRGRGHAVRPRLYQPVFRHQCGEDARRTRRRPHPAAREKALQPAIAVADPRSRRAKRPAPADRRRGHRRRGARHPRRQQAARRPQGGGGQGTGVWRSAQGHARGHRDLDRRSGDLGRPRHQARERHARHARPRQAGVDREGEHDDHRRRRQERRHRRPHHARSGRRSRRRPPITTARSCRSAWPSSRAGSP